MGAVVGEYTYPMSTSSTTRDGGELQGLAGSRVNVWLVDDCPNIHEHLGRNLNVDSSLTCSRQFPSALHLLAALQLPPAPDVILMDVNMPGMSGIEALSHIKKLAPATPVLLISTFWDPVHRQQAVAAGASGLYTKADPVALLVAAIHAASKFPVAPVLMPPPLSPFARLRQLIFGS